MKEVGLQGFMLSSVRWNYDVLIEAGHSITSRGLTIVL